MICTSTPFHGRFIVPYGSPVDLQVEKKSHMSFSCSWEPPPLHLHNGPITQYEVRYIRSAIEQNSGILEAAVKKTKITNQTSTILYSLSSGYNYEVSVRAYTVIGPGVYSRPVTRYTGKCKYFFYYLCQINLQSSIICNQTFLKCHYFFLILKMKKFIILENHARLRNL